MKRLTLKKLSIVNFKGIRALEIEFDHRTDIFGYNRLGKTTIADAWNWVLFGKDTTDRDDSNFQIKPTDHKGSVILKTNPEVEATIEFNGEVIVLKRTLRENWVKKRGQSEAVYEGNQTVYEWNGVVLKAVEFKARLSELINESIFKLLTNTSYFNALKWQERRSLLESMAGVITDSEVTGGDTDLEAAVILLRKHKDMVDFKKWIANQKKRIKDELDLIPARIDEAGRSILHIPDFKQMEGQLAKLQADIDLIELGISNEVEANKKRNQEIVDYQNKARECLTRINQIESEIRQSVYGGVAARANNIKSLKDQFASRQKQLISLQNDKGGIATNLGGATERLANLRALWATINAEQFEPKPQPVFNDADLCCPTCKRRYETNDIENKKAEMLKNFNESEEKRRTEFNENKSRRLNENHLTGKSISESVSGYKTRLEEISKSIADANAEIMSLETAIIDAEKEDKILSETESTQIIEKISSNDEINALKIQIVNYNQKAQPTPNKSLEELNEKKSVLQSQIKEIEKSLAQKEVIERTKARIEELKKDERTKSQELADLENQEFDVDRFNKMRMDIVEQRVNSHFGFVKFKMFDNNIDGTEFPACITLVDGVPYPDANNAAKILAGADIANTFSKYYGVSAPLFIDNAEAVVDQIKTDSQLIRLVVSETDYKLRVEKSGSLQLVG